MIQIVARVACIVLLLLGVVGAKEDQVTLAGQVIATEQEADEGYFQIGTRENMIVAKPRSELHVWLRGKLNQRVKLTLTPDPTTTTH